eukprot:2420053-Rhodomonas_salina.5
MWRMGRIGGPGLGQGAITPLVSQVCAYLESYTVISTRTTICQSQYCLWYRPTPAYLDSVMARSLILIAPSQCCAYLDPSRSILLAPDISGSTSMCKSARAAST